MPRVSSAEDRLEFRDVFGTEAWDDLKGDGRCLTGIRGGKGGWKVCVGKEQQTSWQGRSVSRSRLAALFHKILNFALGSRSLGRDLLSAYADKLHKQSYTSFSDRKVDIPSGVNPATADGYRLASVFDLVGLCKLQELRKGGVKVAVRDKTISEKTISRLDHLVNVSSVRLAYEFFAENKKLPDGYLDRVLIPDFRQQLIRDTSLDTGQATEKVCEILGELSLVTVDDVNFEKLMECKNRLAELTVKYPRQVSSIDGVSRLPRTTTAPAESERAGTISSVPADIILARGSTSFSDARNILVKVLRHESNRTRVGAREAAVAALEGVVGRGNRGRLSFKEFSSAADRLGLLSQLGQQRLVQEYLIVVDRLSGSTPPRRRLPETGEWVNLTDTGESTSGYQIRQIEEGWKISGRPVLAAPAGERRFKCDADDEWMIQCRVTKGHKVRIRRDMIRRMGRWIKCNKRVIGVNLAANIATAVMVGLASGGIAGAFYVLTSTVGSSTMIVMDTVVNHFMCLWHGLKVKAYDAKGKPQQESERKKFFESCSYLTRNSTITDVYNAYFDMKSNVEKLDQLRVKENKSAADQIAYRQEQVIAMSRRRQLGDAAGHLDRLVVEAMTDISKLESEYENVFPTLWEPFDTEKIDPITGQSNGLSESQRIRIFNKAANKAKVKGRFKIAREDRRDWLKKLLCSGEPERRATDEKLRKIFGNDCADCSDLSEVNLAKSSHGARVNWLGHQAAKAADGTRKAIGSFIWTNLCWHTGKIAKIMFKWGVQNVAPNKSALIPVPTAAIAVYWAFSFVGSRIAEAGNNCLNRMRIKKVQDRFGKGKNEIAFDSEDANLSGSDWQAMKGDMKEKLDEFVRLLSALRKEHQEIMQEVTSNLEKFDNNNEQDMVHRASLILRRKNLELQLQEMLTGSIGMFFREVARGDWLYSEIMQGNETLVK